MHGPMKTVTVSGSFLSSILETARIGETVVDILSDSCGMLFDHVNKCRTAGGGHLLTLFISLCHWLLLLQRSYLRRRNLYHICEAQPS